MLICLLFFYVCFKKTKLNLKSDSGCVSCFHNQLYSPSGIGQKMMMLETIAVAREVVSPSREFIWSVLSFISIP